MTDQPKPHDQHDSELQLVLTIGIEGFREPVLGWLNPHVAHACRQRRQAASIPIT